MTSIRDNDIRTPSHDQLELVTGGGVLPIPPIHGGPVHTPPILQPVMGTPISEPLIPMPKPVALM
jgi:hypothetical protein